MKNVIVAATAVCIAIFMTSMYALCVSASEYDDQCKLEEG